jgi:hypothetical protein
MDFTTPGGNPAGTPPRRRHVVGTSMRDAGVLANLSTLAVLLYQWISGIKVILFYRLAFATIDMMNDGRCER